MKLGLRIDVDTSRGTMIGAPNLRKILSDHGITATFFFSVGPDNMGRHIWRLLKPAFFKKMVRSNAARLYGWDILLKGTFWPGPIIGKRGGDIIRAVAADGHETGLHAWDHYRWQTHILHMNEKQINRELLKGYDLMVEIIGSPPVCSAAPGWICNDLILKQKELFSFIYNSDCRGTNLFFPVVNGALLDCPQIPGTLPTYDEIIGRNGITQDNYNDDLLSLIKPGQLNVLTVHAEVEGIICRDLFVDFLKKCRERRITIQPLGRFLENQQRIPNSSLRLGKITGREGLLAIQEMETAET
jgi:undecaprenyl phosphate-alpha-L-ara4FN deformylase